MGVELYELGSTRLMRDSAMRELLGRSIGRLHAKMGFLDQLHGAGRVDEDRPALGPNQHRDRPGI